MAETVHTFEDLKCWQACRALRIYIFKEVVPLFPGNEKYRLGDQVLRAARSTTANLAEGYGRFHYMDNAKFCSNSRGSCYEVLDHLITAHDEGLISLEKLKKGETLVNHAIRLINGYMRYLKNRTKENTTVKEDIAIYQSPPLPDNQ